MALIIRTFVCTLFILLTVNAEEPVVTVDQGNIVGKQLEFSALGSQYRVNAFLGIPYAEAPVGQLRFKPPVAKAWQGELNAQNYGMGCPQLPIPFIEYWTTQNGEDCLLLNVFVPESKPTESAVMVMIHGGGYAVGVGSVLENLDLHPMSAIGDVIVVTINYRLNVLGFLSTGDDVLPGNLGMLDQVEALKWVQKNIAAFGGDPKKVTIFGESAGSGSVSLHTLSPLSKGLFSQAIMQSGTVYSPWAFKPNLETYVKSAFAFGKLVGCESDGSMQLVDCLSAVSADVLVNATERMYEVLPPEDESLLPFGPVVDGHFLPKSVSELTAEKRYNPANMIVGYTAEEGAADAYYMLNYMLNVTDKPTMNVSQFDEFLEMTKISAALDPLKRGALNLVYVDDVMVTSSEPDYLDAFIKLSTDYMYACPSMRYVNEAYDAKIGKVYTYYFNHHPSTSFLSGAWTGACHGDDLMFFGICFLENDYNLSEEECHMTFRMIKYWTNFAKTGNPNIESEEEVASTEEDWPQYSPETRVYKELAPAMKNVIDPNGSRCRVWNDFLPALDAALAVEKSYQSHLVEKNLQTCSTDECTP